MITIRPIEDTDAAAFLALRTRLDQESRLMMLEPDEREQDLEAQHAELRTILARENHTILVAETDTACLAGYLEAEGGRFRRNRHAASIVIGIRQEFQGQGIGSRLLRSVEQWAQQHGITRLELTVMVHNTTAQALYTRMGFLYEGRRRHSLVVEGTFVDEYAMARLLTPSDERESLASTAADGHTGDQGSGARGDDDAPAVDGENVVEEERSGGSGEEGREEAVEAKKGGE